MSWKTLPCPTCNAVAFRSGESYDLLEANGSITGGQMTRHFPLCREPDRLRSDLRARRVLAISGAVAVPFLLSLLGCSYFGGLAHGRGERITDFRNLVHLEGLVGAFTVANQQNQDALLASVDEKVHELDSRYQGRTEQLDVRFEDLVASVGSQIQSMNRRVSAAEAGAKK